LHFSFLGSPHMKVGVHACHSGKVSLAGLLMVSAAHAV
jgi:hypothetical protein